jgi:vacuolar-type H+-ATPase subunit H
MAEAVQEVEEPKVELSSAEEMLEMIVQKEDEIRQSIQKAENDAQRKVEEAKLDAANKKREAAAVEVGEDLRDTELARAREDADKVQADVGAKAEEIRRKGMAKVEEAINIVIEGVLPPR